MNDVNKSNPGENTSTLAGAANAVTPTMSGGTRPPGGNAANTGLISRVLPMPSTNGGKQTAKRFAYRFEDLPDRIKMILVPIAAEKLAGFKSEVWILPNAPAELWTMHGIADLDNRLWVLVGFVGEPVNVPVDHQDGQVHPVKFSSDK